MNAIYDDIVYLFERAGIPNFKKLPNNKSECGKFTKLFKELNDYLEAARIQGFNWINSKYEFNHGKGKPKSVIEMKFDENTYLILALRYKELFNGNSGVKSSEDVPFEIDGHLTEIDTGRIDTDYMNSRFKKYLKALNQGNLNNDQIQQTLNDLHKSFASLTQEEQKYATLFLHDIQSGNATMESGKTFREYITEYQSKAKDEQIRNISHIFGLDEPKLKNMMNSGITEFNINEFGHFDDLKETVDKAKAREYFEKQEGKKIPPFKVSIKTHNLLQEFIIKDGFEIEIPQ